MMLCGWDGNCKPGIILLVCDFSHLHPDWQETTIGSDMSLCVDYWATFVLICMFRWHDEQVTYCSVYVCV